MNHVRVATIFLCTVRSGVNQYMGRTEVKGNFVITNGSSEVGLPNEYYGYRSRGTVVKRYGPSTWRVE